MKILLFEHSRTVSDTHYNDVANAPLAACLTVGYTASVLARAGHDVDVYDAYACDGGLDACREGLLARDCDLLGVHAVYFWEHTPQLFALLEEFARLRPQVPIVLFGIFPTFAYDRILERYPFIRAVVIGEPEAAFAELARQPGRLDGIAGLALCDAGRVRTTSVRPPERNLDALPFPLRHEACASRIGGSVLGTRGCHGSCSFCCINAYYGAGSLRRCRSAANILSEIEQLLPDLDSPYLYFLDADFFGPGAPADRRRVQDIAGGLRPLHVEFGFECRAGAFDEQVLAALVGAGLRDVFLGIESASARSLRRMHKGVTAPRSAASVELLRDFGIEPDLGFIMFDAGSRLGDVRGNFDFLLTNGLLRRLDVTANVLYHREIALRGMPNYASLAEAGRIEATDAFGYEARYRFPEPAVQFLADLMSHICRRVLRAMENARSPICWRRGGSSASQRVNDYMTGLFGDMLRRLELGDVPLDLDGLLRAEDEALCAIEGLIVEERVCQS